ncbi:transcriptional regulator, LacI family [Rhizobium sp. RU20A]|uniref:LacI family DNA-binding transcriptional regulator n=1 Tax=Rhizobium sp. RU20A TaxID=1907412 RepID=UPI00095424B7|nr:LacI family DNA-binding transcriptional regulator [Rhizobium sp. RU20A]SIR36990.1 transcriptional regulator, LacI family [Rhizobium sp. RU20A]
MGVSVSLSDIAAQAGVSVKTVSGALHGGSGRMSDETRQRIKAIADELGYVTNLAARGVRKGWLPLIGVVSDGLITSPFATEIVRGLDGAARSAGMTIFAVNHSGSTTGVELDQVQQFRPRAIAYAAMYHKTVDLSEKLAGAVGVMINCRDLSGRVTSLVPDEEGGARDIVRYLLAAGRRRIAFINLPGILAGTLREKGFRSALAEAGMAPLAVLPAVRRALYSDRAPSLVAAHVEALLTGGDRPDAILCGNDRVAMEAYAALARAGVRIPHDIAVASFDNQIELASRLDPPLTTMALPHRAMGRQAMEILLAEDPAPPSVQMLPFHLVERASV